MMNSAALPTVRLRLLVVAAVVLQVRTRSYPLLHSFILLLAVKSCRPPWGLWPNFPLVYSLARCSHRCQHQEVSILNPVPPCQCIGLTKRLSRPFRCLARFAVAATDAWLTGPVLVLSACPPRCARCLPRFCHLKACCALCLPAWTIMTRP